MHSPTTTVFWRLKTTRRCFDGRSIPVRGFSRRNKIQRCSAYDSTQKSKPRVDAATGAQYGIPRCSAHAMGESNLESGLWSGSGSKLDQFVYVDTDTCRHAKSHRNPCTRFHWCNVAILSVRNAPVSDENGSTYCHSFFTIRWSPNHSSFTDIKHFHKIPTGSPHAGALNTGGV